MLRSRFVQTRQDGRLLPATSECRAAAGDVNPHFSNRIGGVDPRLADLVVEQEVRLPVSVYIFDVASAVRLRAVLARSAGRHRQKQTVLGSTVVATKLSVVTIATGIRRLLARLIGAQRAAGLDVDRDRRRRCSSTTCAGRGRSGASWPRRPPGLRAASDSARRLLRYQIRRRGKCLTLRATRPAGLRTAPDPRTGR
jgi:hypothetical protein